MLYLVATPIGNLGDITLRALEILKSSDLILCEDTRHSQKLMHHFEIKSPLRSYHKFNEEHETPRLIEKLKEGAQISLISDAGTPLISDPGSTLVAACIAEGIEVTALPGACALIQALICSGLNLERFQFIGFLPKKEKELIASLNDLLLYPGVSVCYESPNRLLETVKTLSDIKPSANLVVARELSKKFETFYRGNALALFQKLSEGEIKGECVLLIQGQKPQADYSTLSIEEHILQVEQDFKVPRKEAIKIVAGLRGMQKRTVYRAALDAGMGKADDEP